jgi:hypothetical protein
MLTPGAAVYGSAMGARAVEQLRESAIEVQLASIRSSVHIPVATLWAHYTGGDVVAGLAELDTPAESVSATRTSSGASCPSWRSFGCSAELKCPFYALFQALLSVKYRITQRTGKDLGVRMRWSGISME